MSGFRIHRIDYNILQHLLSGETLNTLFIWFFIHSPSWTPFSHLSESSALDPASTW